MIIDFDTLRKEIISALDDNGIWVLSTSCNDYVTSRSMSIINDGLYIYFQTHECYLKHQQMNKNNNVSLCFSNISIEGKAEQIGNWNDKEHSEILKLYIRKHPASFNQYGLLDGEVVYKVSPTKIILWKYIDGEPVRQVLYVKEERVEQLDIFNRVK